ncbi:hypothetical protein NIES267_25250 [Calothrix parasitica NIES-267]|uniref:DUF4276 family protein n=1 Tax=Calothrix parasitica NIES-267 TaxID=1973488 RepID=A0A1Z4LP94_9CYAN|nr:hypothetical protein NIES267_25250 [Calothrix parasitica NIES-267]
MIRVHVFVEGQTEETFVRELLYEHFIDKNIYLNPILVKTSKTAKGGVVSYAKIKPQINRKCLEDAKSFVTTMFDMYALPKDFPGSGLLPKINEPGASQFCKRIGRSLHYSRGNLANNVGLYISATIRENK